LYLKDGEKKTGEWTREGREGEERGRERREGEGRRWEGEEMREGGRETKRGGRGKGEYLFSKECSPFHHGLGIGDHHSVMGLQHCGIMETAVQTENDRG